MLLKTSISNTKKFFKRSIQSFKSFFSGGYQRLPKTPLCNPFPCSGGATSFNRSYRQLDNFYADIIEAQKEIQKKVLSTKTHNNEEADLIKLGSSTKREQEKKKRNNYGYEGKCGRGKEDGSWKRGMEERSCLVTETLRALEMMDGNNVDHVLDIQEALHYYSRLTCPAYRDIVDKFFMEMYSEFFHPIGR